MKQDGWSTLAAAAFVVLCGVIGWAWTQNQSAHDALSSRIDAMSANGLAIAHIEERQTSLQSQIERNSEKMDAMSEDIQRIGEGVARIEGALRDSRP